MKEEEERASTLYSVRSDKLCKWEEQQQQQEEEEEEEEEEEDPNGWRASRQGLRRLSEYKRCN